MDNWIKLKKMTPAYLMLMKLKEQKADKTNLRSFCKEADKTLINK